MSIKSDLWIRRMADQHKMIEPFEAGQVRDKNGERLISYGTSSYGYDVRCSREFKVFTNINSATVDPKVFDSASFVDVESDVCVIPPNKSLTLSANTSSECNATSSATYLAIIAPNSHSYASADRNILAMVSLNAIHAVEPSRLINSAVICATFDFNGYGTFAPPCDVEHNSFEIIFVNSFFIKISSSSLVFADIKSRCKIEYPKCLFSTFSSSPPPLSPPLFSHLLSINFFAINTTECTSIVLLSTGPVNSSSMRDNECIRATRSSSLLVV